MKRLSNATNALRCVTLSAAVLFAFSLPQALVHGAEEETAKKPVAAAADETDAAPQIQMAILLDTSGSMNGLINQARTQLWQIVNQFATAKQNGKAPQLQVALYEYGNDGLPAEEGFLRMIVPLTDDLDKVSQELFALTTNGGQEYCGQTIDAAVRQLQWSKSERDLKCIFIAGNEPFTQGPVDYKKACKSAIEKGITVSTIHCGDLQVGINTKWQDGALLADGSYLSINQNQAVAVIKAPQDKKLAELSGKLNTTYVAYGSAKKREEFATNQAVQDTNAANSAPASAATRAYFKASGLYNNARWDLCDACAQGKIKLEDLKEEDLPEELKKLSLKERKAYIDKKIEERKKYQKEIKELSAERNKYVAAERAKLAKKGENSLDAAIIKSVRDQAVRKQFKFEE